MPDLPARHMKLEAVCIVAPDESLTRRAAILAYDSQANGHFRAFDRRLGWPGSDRWVPRGQVRALPAPAWKRWKVDMAEAFHAGLASRAAGILDPQRAPGGHQGDGHQVPARDMALC